MEPNCEQGDERLLAYLLDEVEPDERQKIETHLAQCDACAKELDSLRLTVGRLQGELRSSPAEPRLSEQRVEELKAGNVRTVGGGSSDSGSGWFRWGALAAAGVFGLLAGGIYLGIPNPPVAEPARTFRLADAASGTPALSNNKELRSSGGASMGRSEEAMGEEVALMAPKAPGQVAVAEIDRDGAFQTNEMELRREAAGIAVTPMESPQEASGAVEADDLRASVGAKRESDLAGAGGNEAIAPASKGASALASADAELTGGERPRGSEPQPVAPASRMLADAPTAQIRAADGIETERMIAPMPTPIRMPAPSPGTTLPNDEKFDAMYFQDYGVNPFIDTEEDPLSTFGVDVDTASYAIVRNYLNRQAMPPPRAVRVEEFVNYFPSEYPAPNRQTFAVYSEVAPSPFRSGYSLLKIGIKGREVAPGERKPVVLTFVVDVSGSMAREDRLGLVKQTLQMLLRELRPGDRVGLAVYGSRGQEILSHHDITDEGAIERGIELLQPGGSTNAEEGLRIGYAMARRAFDPGAVNRVILCTDGVANVGRTGADSILDTIGREANDRIYLTTLGFGLGNYNDVLLEQLADKGNGHYAYLDTENEARDFIRHRLADSMEVIAQDVKIQVELDPAVVSKYRLLGYENRDIADRDFRNERVDAGEIGAGHAVTALYEVKLREGIEGEDLGVLRLRYKEPESRLAVKEIEGRLDGHPRRRTFEEASDPFKQASVAAGFAEWLRHSYWAKETTIEQLIQLYDRSFGRADRTAELAELRQLMGTARRLSGPSEPRPVPMGSPGIDEEPHTGEERAMREDAVQMRESAAPRSGFR